MRYGDPAQRCISSQPAAAAADFILASNSQGLRLGDPRASKALGKSLKPLATKRTFLLQAL
jgi:hypothetical protein